MLKVPHVADAGRRRARAINPRAVVPQHFDDFFPPVSQWVELMPFAAMVEKLAPECRYYEPAINEVFTARDVLGD